MQHVVPRPESYDAVEITESTASADLQELYQAAKPDGTATVTVMKMGSQVLVSTTDSPSWVGQFTAGDLVMYSEPIFVRLGAAENYVPYDSVYVTHAER